MTLYKTGEICTISGNYRFAGHIGGSTGCHPTSEERIIPLEYGERFPPIRSCSVGAYWSLV